MSKIYILLILIICLLGEVINIRSSQPKDDSVGFAGGGASSISHNHKNDQNDEDMVQELITVIDAALLDPKLEYFEFQKIKSPKIYEVIKQWSKQHSINVKDLSVLLYKAILNKSKVNQQDHVFYKAVIMNLGRALRGDNINLRHAINNFFYSNDTMKINSFFDYPEFHNEEDRVSFIEPIFRYATENFFRSLALDQSFDPNLSSVFQMLSKLSLDYMWAIGFISNYPLYYRCLAFFDIREIYFKIKDNKINEITPEEISKTLYYHLFFPPFLLNEKFVNELSDEQIEALFEDHINLGFKRFQNLNTNFSENFTLNAFTLLDKKYNELLDHKNRVEERVF